MSLLRNSHCARVRYVPFPARSFSEISTHDASARKSNRSALHELIALPGPTKPVAAAATYRMQGPRLPSHAAGRQITLERLARPEQKEHEQDAHRIPEADDGDLRSAGNSGTSTDITGVAHDPGEPPSMRCRDQDDCAKEDGSSDTCRKGSASANRLNRALRWSRRHLRFVGPGLSELCIISFSLLEL